MNLKGIIKSYCQLTDYHELPGVVKRISISSDEKHCHLSYVSLNSEKTEKESIALNTKKIKKTHPYAKGLKYFLPKIFGDSLPKYETITIKIRKKVVNRKNGNLYLFIRYRDLEPGEPQANYDENTGKKLDYQLEGERVSKILFDVTKDGQIIVTSDGNGIGEWQLQRYKNPYEIMDTD